MQRLRAAPNAAEAHEQAVLLTEAYAVLSNPERRAAYDLARDIALSRREADFAATAVLDPDAARYAAHHCLFCGAAHGLERVLEPDDDCRECASPLYPAERQRLQPSGKRMLQRIPRRRAVELYVAWPQPEPYAAEMRDLSLNGMQLATSAPLRPNQIVRIACAACATVARVAHCEREETPPGVDRLWIVGVEFLTLRFANARGTFVSARA
jgi:hypothetical protein